MHVFVLLFCICHVMQLSVFQQQQQQPSIYLSTLISLVTHNALQIPNRSCAMNNIFIFPGVSSKNCQTPLSRCKFVRSSITVCTEIFFSLCYLFRSKFLWLWFLPVIWCHCLAHSVWCNSKALDFFFTRQFYVHVFVNLIGLAELILQRWKIKSRILSGLQSSTFHLTFIYIFNETSFIKSWKTCMTLNKDNTQRNHFSGVFFSIAVILFISNRSRCTRLHVIFDDCLYYSNARGCNPLSDQMRGWCHLFHFRSHEYD